MEDGGRRRWDVIDPEHGGATIVGSAASHARHGPPARLHWPLYYTTTAAPCSCPYVFVIVDVGSDINADSREQCVMCHTLNLHVVP